MDPKGDWCFITGFLVMMCAVGGVIGQPLLSINRYFAMFHPEKSKKFFKKPYCICMVIGIYVLSFLSAYSFVPFDEYGRFEGICCIAVYEMKIWHMFVFFTSPMIISYAISLYCAFNISKLIRKQTEAKNDRKWC
uniref:G-protein coupled receptors family 1 profile domain-containing protein n=1 Tax=Romanomermis culicivorax TaxID=13658 RepID=A0A915KYU4_ROMCU